VGFFRRFAEGLGHSTRVEGLAEAAASWGWEPAGDEPFDDRLTDLIHGVARALHGVFRRVGWSRDLALAHTHYHDAYRATVGGRAVTLANAWMAIEALVAGGRRVEGSAVLAVELSTALMIAGIEPRGRHNALPRKPEIPTGDSSFDATYRVVGFGPLSQGVVTPEMQRRIAARDDWAFIAHESTFVSICREPFATPDEVSQRVRDVLAIVMALPTSVAPAQVDHSVDDLLARIARIDNVEQAVAFLQQLSDADRQRLAASPTPLAKFADVCTPEEATARMMSLPELERLQVLAMFDKVNHD
jgi:hypothetical protein